MHKILMFQDSQVTSNHDIFQNRTIWNIDLITIITHNDDSTFQLDTLTNSNVTSNGQVI